MTKKNAKVITLTGLNLDIDIVYQVAFCEPGQIKLEIDNDAYEKMKRARAFVNEIVKKGDPVYSINTGFGALSDKKIDNNDLEKLQLNLIRSHCVGVGRPFDRGTTRAIMLLRANCLISGYSGITPETVNLLLDLLNFHINPVVPEKGSVGASGDLAPLSHIALALIGEGDVEYKGKILPSSFVFNELGLKPAKLGPKDGLALINGTAVMAALGSLCVYEAKKVAKMCDIAGALTVEAVRGTKVAFDEKISQMKPHPGQIKVASNLNVLLKDSSIMDSHHDCGRVQDPYSLRCMPQVHGACRQTIEHAEQVITLELNAVTDNPLIFLEQNEVLSGGNFHGEAIALAMDYLAMGLSELCSICERRIEKMMNPTFSDLPHFLTQNSGLNSGLMIAHVTVAALTSENKILCHPASVDSIPTSTDKEDHVSMGVTSGRKLVDILRNLKTCIAIEFLANTQALEFLKPHQSSPALMEVYHLIRNHVPPITEDRIFYKDIEKINRLVSNQEILTVVESAIGELQ